MLASDCADTLNLDFLQMPNSIFLRSHYLFQKLYIQSLLSGSSTGTRYRTNHKCSKERMCWWVWLLFTEKLNIQTWARTLAFFFMGDKCKITLLTGSFSLNALFHSLPEDPKTQVRLPQHNSLKFLELPLFHQIISLPLKRTYDPNLSLKINMCLKQITLLRTYSSQLHHAESIKSCKAYLDHLY